jgi:hypothetical protein
MRVEVAWMRALAQGGAATAGRDADPASYLGSAGTLVDEVLARGGTQGSRWLSRCSQRNG